MKFTKSTGENKTTTEEVKVGFITSAISMLSRLLGSQAKVDIPEAADPETFTRNVSTTEALNVTLPYVDLGARFNAEFEGYLDTSGATMMAFAVTDFDMYDAAWSPNSLYRKQPDPSLVLPYKFVYQSGNQTFVGNTDYNKAYQMKGMNFSDILEDIANMLERQKNGEEIPEEELAEAREKSANLIAFEEVTLFPGQNYEVYLTLNEQDIANIRSSYLDWGLAGMVFAIDVPEEAVASTPEADSESEPGSESQPGGESALVGVGSSSGGCDTGVFGVMGAAAALLMLTQKRRN